MLDVQQYYNDTIRGAGRSLFVEIDRNALRSIPGRNSTLSSIMRPAGHSKNWRYDDYLLLSSILRGPSVDSCSSTVTNRICSIQDSTGQGKLASGPASEPVASNDAVDDENTFGLNSVCDTLIVPRFHPWIHRPLDLPLWRVSLPP